MGDLLTVSLLHRNNLQLAWNPYGGTSGMQGAEVPVDLFRRNQAVLRAEIRVGLEILSTKTLRVASLTAGA